MPFVPPLAEMLLKFNPFAPMVTLRTLSAIPAPEEIVFGEFVASLVVYSTELLTLLVPPISTALPPADVTLTSLIVNSVGVLTPGLGLFTPAARPDAPIPFVPPALVLMLSPWTTVFSFIVTVPR